MQGLAYKVREARKSALDFGRPNVDGSVPKRAVNGVGFKET